MQNRFECFDCKVCNNKGFISSGNFVKPCVCNYGYIWIRQATQVLGDMIEESCGKRPTYYDLQLAPKKCYERKLPWNNFVYGVALNVKLGWSAHWAILLVLHHPLVLCKGESCYVWSDGELVFLKGKLVKGLVKGKPPANPRV